MHRRENRRLLLISARRNALFLCIPAYKIIMSRPSAHLFGARSQAFSQERAQTGRFQRTVLQWSCLQDLLDYDDIVIFVHKANTTDSSRDTARLRDRNGCIWRTQCIVLVDRNRHVPESRASTGHIDTQPPHEDICFSRLLKASNSLQYMQIPYFKCFTRVARRGFFTNDLQ